MQHDLADGARPFEGLSARRRWARRLRKMRRALSRRRRRGGVERAETLPVIEPLEQRLLLSVTAMIDYTYDTQDFFDTQEKRDLLQFAADMIVSRFEDTLDAIVASGSNTWDAVFTHPGTGAEQRITDLFVPADTVIIYAGGRSLGGSTLGRGGPGGFSASGTGTFLNTLESRGEPGADRSLMDSEKTDFAPWGGSIVFDNDANRFDGAGSPSDWFFGETTAGLGVGEVDFLSVAVHEIMHLLGFGTADSFDNLISGGDFTGAAATALYDSGINGNPTQTNPPLHTDVSHWQNGLIDEGSETSMDPSITSGARKLNTELDFAAMMDIGWEVSDNSRPIVADDAYAVNEDNTLTVTAANDVLDNDNDFDSDPLTTSLVSTTNFGMLTFNGDGTFTYVPNDNFFGTDTFTYIANDGQAENDDSTTATVTITVNPVNDDPEAFGDVYFTNEDNDLVVSDVEGVLGNDDDIDLDPLDAVLVSDVANGTLTLNDNGSFTYSPDNDFFGSDSFTYKANDGTADSNTVTVQIAVIPVNDDPVANADSAYVVDEDMQLTVTALNGVLANDTDVDMDGLSATKLTDPANGSVSLSLNGGFTYTPDEDFNGTDTFTYTVSDGNGGSDTGTVTITVNSVNDAPVAANDTFGVMEEGTLMLNGLNGVLMNDSDSHDGAPDENNTPFTVTLVSDVSNGMLTLGTDGSVTYTPDGDFFGSDTFTYTVTDDEGDASNTATATINVSNVNDDPVAVDDAYMVGEDGTLITTLFTGVLDNDTDIENDGLMSAVLTDPDNGSVSLSLNGGFTYTPDEDFNGTDTFTYTVTDGNGGSDTGTVTITVNSVNDAPDVAADAYMVDEDNTLNVDAMNGVLSNDSDAHGGTANENNTPLTVTLVGDVSNGVLTLNDDGSFSYTPDDDFNGTDTFTYTADDNLDATSTTATVTITVDPVNDDPVATDDGVYNIGEDNTLNVDAMSGLLDNDSDLDGDDLTAAKLTDPSNGSVTVNLDGSFTYTPDEDFNGTDTFTYTIDDDNGGGDTATVTINVTSINDAPDVADDAYMVDEDNTLNVDAMTGVLSNDSDAHGGTANENNTPLTVALNSDVSNGTLMLDDDGSFTYTPDEDFNGTDTFTYTATDNLGGVSTVAMVTITVNSVNDAPVANDDAYDVNEDINLVVNTPIGTNVNDTDVEGDILRADVVSDPSHGTVTLQSSGFFQYVPEDDFNGTDTFTYTVHDGLLTSNTATVTITVNSVNDAPDSTDDAYMVDEDNTLNVDAMTGVLSNDSDAHDGAPSENNLPLTVDDLISDVSNGTLMLDDDGSFTYTPDEHFFGTDTFTYTVADDLGGVSTVATVTITVNSVNDPPVATGEQYMALFNMELSVDQANGVLSNDDDPVEGDALTAQLVGDVSNGTLMLNADGSFTYTPTDGFSGTDSFTYVANDGDDSNTATVSIRVGGNLDVDDNNDTDALTDGILVVRYLANFSGDTLVDGVLGINANRTDPADIIDILVGSETGFLDADGNGVADALTDGILIVRYLANFSGDTLVDGVIGNGATRTTGPEVIAFLSQFELMTMPPPLLESLVVEEQGAPALVESEAETAETTPESTTGSRPQADAPMDTPVDVLSKARGTAIFNHDGALPRLAPLSPAPLTPFAAFDLDKTDTARDKARVGAEPLDGVIVRIV